MRKRRLYAGLRVPPKWAIVEVVVVSQHRTTASSRQRAVGPSGVEPAWIGSIVTWFAPYPACSVVR